MAEDHPIEQFVGRRIGQAFAHPAGEAARVVIAEEGRQLQRRALAAGTVRANGKSRTDGSRSTTVCVAVSDG